jgi:enoyl-CoA hydratase/carnithine racemase
LNAFTAASYQCRLARALDDADADPQVAVVLMQGAGRGFSSGVDLAAMETEPRALAETFDELLGSLVRFSKPLLAAVHGVGVGFGVTLLHCDLVLVAETARLRLPFTALGTTPEAASSALLPQLVGLRRAADLLLTSRWFSGHEAAAIGLASRSCPDESVHTEALATAHALAELPAPALVAAKRLVRAGASDTVREALGRERAAAGEFHDILGPIAYRGPPEGGAAR